METGDYVTGKLEALLLYVQEGGRVCPQPDLWNKLWKMLPNRKPTETGWNPPLPLILGGWWYSTNLDKALLLSDHILYAAENGVLDGVDAYLRGLSEDQWHRI